MYASTVSMRVFIASLSRCLSRPCRDISQGMSAGRTIFFRLALRAGAVSASFSSSSYSFSPGRNPVTTISISPSDSGDFFTLSPESSIMRSAKSRMRTGSPMSSTKMPPSRPAGRSTSPTPRTEACRTSPTASRTVMK